MSKIVERLKALRFVSRKQDVVIDEAVNTIEQLQAELEDYHDAEKFVNDPPHDQVCCGCVAILRKQLKQLQAENKQLEETLANYSLLEECSPPDWPRKKFVKHLFSLWERQALKDGE